jgi:LCP family protein required for cell wall assembly
MTENQRYTNKNKKKKKSIFRKILWFFLVMFLIVGGYAAYMAFAAFKAADMSFDELSRGEKSNLRDEMVKPATDPVSVLLMGVENYSSAGAGGRTDTLIVMTLNPKEKTMKMLSIPRDTLVSIPGRLNQNKINHSYSYGGKELTIETVEDFLDIPIDYYATVSFDGFKDIVDELDGVEVDVPFDFWEKSDENNDRIYFTEGLQELNGEEALAYARMRKRDPRGDFGRNDRQKQIITAAIEKATSPVNLFKIDDLATHVGKNVETNVRISEALSFQKSYSGFQTSKINKLTMEGEDQYIENVYYFKPDEIKLDEIKEELSTHLEHSSSYGSTDSTNETP